MLLNVIKLLHTFKLNILRNFYLNTNSIGVYKSQNVKTSSN
jgi:hypothetical protein